MSSPTGCFYYAMSRNELKCMKRTKFAQVVSILIWLQGAATSRNNTIFHVIITTFKILFVNFTLQKNFSFLTSLNLLHIKGVI